MPLSLFVSSSARARLDAALNALVAVSPLEQALIVGASRGAADELAFAAAKARGGLFGVRRAGFLELALSLALPALARDGLSPMSSLGVEAMVARAVHDALRGGTLEYLAPVATFPGFARAAASTLQELQLAGIPAARVRGVSQTGPDLAELLQRLEQSAAASAAAPRARVFTEAAAALRADSSRLGALHVVLVDLAIASAAEAEFVEALVAVAPRVAAVCPEGDARSRAVLDRLGAPQPVPDSRADTALARVQTHLFSPATPPRAVVDDTVSLFSAPGEGREAVEIARRVLREAARGVPFDEMAVLLRAPQTYSGLIEHAFARAGIPAWFERGTRRPDPAGRALLALLSCAEEQLSARRFAEYLSLGQVPAAAPAGESWPAPADEIASALVPEADRPEDPAPIDEAPLPGERDGDRVVAGTLQAPWRWEELLVEACVIGGLDRWRRRLPGLRREYERRIRALLDEEPDSARLPALQRQHAQLQHLEEFALPIVETLDAWRDAQPWAVWLERLTGLAPRVLRQPARVLRVLGEMAPLGGVGPVTVREVREVLAPRLRTLTHEPPRRRQGRVFVGSCHAARGRSFRIVFVPGLAERVFPQRVREDALLLDARRVELEGDLPRRAERADEERLQLRLAIGAASERIYVSYPRVELRESRPRVPSFYVLEIARAATGDVPRYTEVADAALRAGGASLAWPAPSSPDDAIDDLEHDLAVLRPLLHEVPVQQAAGRARYLLDLNPTLRRSIIDRWARHRRQWSKHDGLIWPSADAIAALAPYRLDRRPYSLTALQRYAACPYQFLLAAIYRLAPVEEPAPLQRLDPLTRGSLFHEIQAVFYRTLQANGQLPVTRERLAVARQQLEWAIARVAREAEDALAPAIERVWADEIASLRRDLLLWLDRLADDGEWVPERFELAFGLPPDDARDASSVGAPAIVGGRFQLRGSIDLVERHTRTRALRVTDHKTGKNRTPRSAVVNGGQMLQPVLYGLALEALTGETVQEARLWYCTMAGGFDVHTLPLTERERRAGLEVLEIVDRAVERGPLAARPWREACRWCDFVPVCGRDEENRTTRKPDGQMPDLDALRRMP